MIDTVLGTPMLTTLVTNTNGFNSKATGSYKSLNNHIDLNNLSFATPYPLKETIQHANGESLSISHIGSSIIKYSIAAFEIKFNIMCTKIASKFASEFIKFVLIITIG